MIGLLVYAQESVLVILSAEEVLFSTQSGALLLWVLDIDAVAISSDTEENLVSKETV